MWMGLPEEVTAVKGTKALQVSSLKEGPAKNGLGSRSRSRVLAWTLREEDVERRGSGHQRSVP